MEHSSSSVCGHGLVTPLDEEPLFPLQRSELALVFSSPYLGFPSLDPELSLLPNPARLRKVVVRKLLPSTEEVYCPGAGSLAHVLLKRRFVSKVSLRGRAPSSPFLTISPIVRMKEIDFSPRG